MAKNFFASLMASEDVRTKLFTGVFYADGEKAEIHDGALVVRGEMEDHSVYSGLKDHNKYKITAPAANTDRVAVVDYVDVSNGNIMGVNYREGIKTFGLVAPAGVPVRVRIVERDDQCFFAEGNFESAPTVGEFAIPTAGKTTWTPTSTAATDKTCIKIEEAHDVTEGAVLNGKEYFVTFVNAL